MLKIFILIIYEIQKYDLIGLTNANTHSQKYLDVSSQNFSRILLFIRNYNSFRYIFTRNSESLFMLLW